jgi:GT2 family glycosyltransferase
VLKASSGHLPIESRSNNKWQQLYAAAACAVAKKEWELAESLLIETLALEPNHASAHHLFGKMWASKGNTAKALAAQQRSCALDPELGWNFFAAGELLMQEGRFSEAISAFDQALAVLPDQGWIQVQAQEARLAAELDGEQIIDGLGPKTYRYWITHHEQRLSASSMLLQQEFWLLETGDNETAVWRALHSQAPLQPKAAPLGESVWPMQGWLVLLGAGVLLRPGALQTIETWLQMDCLHQQPDLIYADEDELNTAGERSNPWFKPGWVEESFWASPWLGGMSLWRISWLRNQELPLPPGDQCGRFRWMLQALERKPSIGQVPLVLSHNKQKPEKFSVEALNALRQHLLAQGEAIAQVNNHEELLSCISLQWALAKQWSCTVIIPSRDRADLLASCLNSIWHTSQAERLRGAELELVVVDNGSVQQHTQELLQHWKENLGERFRVIKDNNSFNWSRLNNKAAAIARGELLLLLNNDIEALQPNWLAAMAAQALRPKVGCVGALLLYPDQTIQHGGVIFGLQSADHAYRGLPHGHKVHRGRSRLLTAWGAVTGACLMMRRELLVRVGGFDEGLPVEFNDVDLCLRLGQLGYRHVIPPEAVLVHHESQSRDANGSSTATAALKRIQQRWPASFATAKPWWPEESERNYVDGRPVGLEGLPLD